MDEKHSLSTYPAEAVWQMDRFLPLRVGLFTIVGHNAARN